MEDKKFWIFYIFWVIDKKKPEIIYFLEIFLQLYGQKKSIYILQD